VAPNPARASRLQADMKMSGFDWLLLAILSLLGGVFLCAVGSGACARLYHRFSSGFLGRMCIGDDVAEQAHPFPRGGMWGARAGYGAIEKRLAVQLFSCWHKA